MTFDLPMPPSVNGMYRNVSGRGRVKTDPYKRWIKEAGQMLMLQWKAPRQTITNEVRVNCDLERPKVRSDVDNRAKALLDLMKGMGLLKDDSLVVDLRLRWADIRGCRVTVEVLS